MALAIFNMVSSVPVPLKAFIAHRMNRQLSGVYPTSGFIRSMLGENMREVCLPSFRSNSIPEMAHCPVHIDFAHSLLMLKGTFLATARLMALAIKLIQGECARV